MNILVIANEIVDDSLDIDGARVCVVAPALNSRLRHWLSDVDASLRNAEDRLDDGDGEDPARRAVAVRVEDVVAARVRARRGDREIACFDDRGDAVADGGMLDADAPAAAHADVAARVDGVAAQAALVEDRRRAVDRPALDEPRRI